MITPNETENMENTENHGKSDAVFHAVFIGFMIGIVIFSVVKNTVGLVTLIPLYVVYRFMRSSRTDD